MKFHTRDALQRLDLDWSVKLPHHVAKAETMTRVNLWFLGYKLNSGHQCFNHKDQIDAEQAEKDIAFKVGGFESFARSVVPRKASASLQTFSIMNGSRKAIWYAHLDSDS